MPSRSSNTVPPNKQYVQTALRQREDADVAKRAPATPFRNNNMRLLPRVAAGFTPLARTAARRNGSERATHPAEVGLACSRRNTKQANAALRGAG